MSRQNKVNPAHYTQRGRLTQDDAARELTRQRSIGSQHTWQPVQKNALPSLPFNHGDADRSAETSEEAESPSKQSNTRKASTIEKSSGVGRVRRSSAGATSKASTVKKTSDVGRVRRSGPAATSKARTAKAPKRAVRTTAAKTTAAKTAARTTRKAVLARSVGGPALKPLREATRRKR